MKEFKLPDVGEGLTEAEIVRWHVKVGDPVKVNQTIVEIETAKAVVELPCPFEGVVSALLADEGETVDVGKPIIRVDDGSAPAAPAGGAALSGAAGGRDGGAAEPAGRGQALADDMVPAVPEEAGGPGGSGKPKEERQPVLVGYGVKMGAAKRRARKQPSTGPSTGSSAPGGARAPEGLSRAGAVPQSQPQPAPASAPAGAGRVAVLAKPPVRKLAKDLGVDLATLTGTGPQGSITRDDVHTAANAAPGQDAGTARPGMRAVPSGGEERIPVKGVRKATAQAMVASAFTAPHVTEFLQVDVTATMEAVTRLRALPDFAEVKVSPLLLVAKAVLVAARRHPMINSAWDEAAQEIVVKHYVNLGIAAATPRGLLVPNVKDAHALSLPELAAALGGLVETARAGRTQPADMAGGTFTITNVGVFGVDAGTPILNPGESAILAFGQVRDMPWVVDGQIVPRKVCTLALSFDHRVVDGELGSLFLRDVGAMLEDPLRMLAWG
ncbi:dihydrolipoamide acetyltransferase family protein [Planobispora longispora]|uniref:Dihydrolipoamide acetyltransferase component of pyruvate dehydrogenase complex n=1 Tax=Planobispora longispora TaxID=28887 RepID=A0A8J3RNK5_9ACTN|nr:dihydrolipoamide acetyltransferase family protein [Planobispora longispora]GIH78952.1 dihydrolipoamide acetyltransferase component of pyruvate dehydrogenase complex [Planobispora longispora]